MKGLYTSPGRVYLVVILIAILGIISGFELPISLYPNSTKPTVWTGIKYGSLTANEFLDTYGKTIEAQLKTINVDGHEVEKVISDYGKSQGNFKVEFRWETDPKKAKREVQNTMNALSASWSKEIRDSLWVNFWSRSSGFVAISYYSDERNIDELYQVLAPVLEPKLARVKDAQEATLWNPNRKEIRVIFYPMVLTSLGVLPSDIQRAVSTNLTSRYGGTIRVGDKQLLVQMPRTVQSVDSLKKMLVPLNNGEIVHLSELAKVEYGKIQGHNRIIKTNGITSIILYSAPRAGGNVKRLSEEIIKIVEESKKELPEDVRYRTLVDPSQFIRSSVENVFHEVFLAAFIAVAVLFLFVGSFKNTITAALEIPLSMVLAFIMMKITNMNINLISLGGLALAAGMNVDASIVVLENIMRHMENYTPKTFNEKLKIVMNAVNEVRLPIIASTISTLVVFAPLAFTHNLTNAILGDLAKAIVFSHGFSMIIALCLVPTIRLHILGGTKVDKLPKAPLDSFMKRVTKIYLQGLNALIAKKYLRWLVLGIFVLLFVLSSIFIIPNLKKEIIGKPDTDWMILAINTSGNSEVKQMETETSRIEDDLLTNFGKYIQYTFTQIRRPNNSSIMARLKNKGDMTKVWGLMEEKYQNTPKLFFWVGPWNPAELPLPDPPHLTLEIKGGSAEDRRLLGQDLITELKEREMFPRMWSEPSVSFKQNIVLRPNYSLWSKLYQNGIRFTPNDLIDLARVATNGKTVDYINLNGKNERIFFKFPKDVITDPHTLGAYPLKINNKIIPLKAIADVSVEKSPPSIYREDERGIVLLHAKQTKGKDHLIKSSSKKVHDYLKEYKTKSNAKLKLKTMPNIFVKESFKELNDSLKQLGISVSLSILLILFILLLQFGSVIHSLIIMVAIPAGILGGAISLFIFNSTLSLNSVLGIILLNGVAVNNSIILVDFIRKLVDQGIAPKDAALLAASKRLKPILITSLTTILGMLPIAFGMGEGGKILQPLGIAVTGGLWFSMIFTLFVVPLLEVIFLRIRRDIKFDKDVNKNDHLKTTVIERNMEITQ